VDDSAPAEVPEVAAKVEAVDEAAPEVAVTEEAAGA